MKPNCELFSERFRTAPSLPLLGVLLLGLAVAWPAEPQEAPAAPTKAQPQNHNEVRKAIQWKRFDYTCENGAKVTVYLHDTMAKVRYEDHVYLMKQTMSADGNRYSDGKTVWWGKGEGGFLQEDTPDGSGEMILKDCVLEKPVAADTVTGTITYLVRMALPTQATVQVQLLGMARSDAPATVIAQEKFALGTKQVPIPFTLKYNPAKIESTHSYSVSAKVFLGSEVKFASDQVYPVLTKGNPSNVDLILKPAKP